MYLRVIGNSSFWLLHIGQARLNRLERVFEHLKKQPRKYTFSNLEILICNCSFPGIFKERSIGAAPDHFPLRMAL